MLEAYRQQRWDEADLTIAECRALDHRLDDLYDVYQSRIRAMRQNPPGPGWNGVLGRVLVTAGRQPVLTCARHLGIRHWVSRRATCRHRRERRGYHDYSHVFRLQDVCFEYIYLYRD
jgi:hypothetical protein